MGLTDRICNVHGCWLICFFIVMKSPTYPDCQIVTYSHNHLHWCVFLSINVIVFSYKEDDEFESLLCSCPVIFLFPHIYFHQQGQQVGMTLHIFSYDVTYILLSVLINNNIWPVMLYLIDTLTRMFHWWSLCLCLCISSITVDSLYLFLDCLLPNNIVYLF